MLPANDLKRLLVSSKVVDPSKFLPLIFNIYLKRWNEEVAVNKTHDFLSNCSLLTTVTSVLTSSHELVMWNLKGLTLTHYTDNVPYRLDYKMSFYSLCLIFLVSQTDPCNNLVGRCKCLCRSFPSVSIWLPMLRLSSVCRHVGSGTAFQLPNFPPPLNRQTQTTTIPYHKCYIYISSSFLTFPN